MLLLSQTFYNIYAMSYNNWKGIGSGRRAGVLVPLFSIYSKNSFGIGDFSDLKLLIDWCHKAGLSILQLLPMNEVSSTFCPYDAISSFALEPAYISIDSKRGRPHKGGHVDYKVREEKDRELWNLWKMGAYPNKSNKWDVSPFSEFVKSNSYWIEDFALFKVLKRYHGGRPWYEWDAYYKDRDPGRLGDFRKEHDDEVSFQEWLQWAAFNQFKEAKSYAESKDVKICGDLPILISRDSADVWAHPEYFKLDFAAGAPPDMYCAKGQRWGVPTYRWDKIAADDYRYLKEKLGYAENFYDILRIDHVVGLFRIWSIPYNEPAENEGLNGSFDPGDENTWKSHGEAILSVMIKNTKMLLTAEDLGVIPNECPETLEEFKIPGNSVQRWAKDWNVKHDFLKPKDYKKLSVVMLSTHDTTNWAAWWENEAGTVDEALFIRKAIDRNIDYKNAIKQLFDPDRSGHGRLRWREDIDSQDKLVSILDKPKEHLKDFIDMYENSYLEKEKLWKQLKIKGPMREKSDAGTVKAALNMTLNSAAVFCVELLNDYLFLTDLFKGDPYKYRINRPGTVNKENWSLTIPVSLERLSKDKLGKEIRAMVKSARPA